MPEFRLQPSFQQFLADLERHNDRAWFDANRSRYVEDVQEPCLQLVRALAPGVKALSKHLLVSDKKVGGAMSRLHRDTRFGADKSPFHTHVTLRLPHTADPKGPGPGLYLRLAKDGATAGTGTWMPEQPVLGRIREAIAADPKGWLRARHDPAFVKAFGALQGEQLQRVPKEFPAGHPAGDDLRRKSWCGFADLPAKAVVRADFVEALCGRWAASAPLLRFLAKAVGLSF